MTTTVTVLTVLALAGRGLAHVALTFPQAKYPAYDFLDNTRTGSPCGVKDEPQSSRTTLVGGEYYNFTFHLAYPHSGGFCFNILNKDGEVQHSLTDGFIKNDLSTGQQYTVKIPNITCPDCQVQLMRQALEWAGPPSYNEVYLFWSCANVNIVKGGNTEPECGGTSCTGHGTCTNGTCVCSGTWYGQYCQYQDGCLSDAECGNGTCVDLSSTSAPRKECFCNPGWHGLKCEKMSSLTDPQFNPAGYKGYLKAKDNLEYWYTHSGDYIEVAIKYTRSAGKSEWIGFGFRSNSESTQCWKTAPGYLPATLTNNDQDVQAWGGASDNEDWGTPIRSSPEGEVEGEGEGEGEGGGSLHAMDCTDIVISRVKGNQYRILDYYTRDRSTPQVDEWYGGEQNLIGAVGAEVDGVTWIRFRKPIRSSDNFDSDVENAATHIIWAHGQVIGQYDPPVPTSKPANPALITNFYQPLELKYHGGSNRGQTVNNFMDPYMTTCSYAHSCASAGNCYTAKWGLHPNNNQIMVFELTLGGGGTNWVGIGFSNDNFMPMTDVVTGYVSGGGASVQDRYATQKALPPIDSDQSQILVSDGSVADGKLTIQFQRSLTSTDAQDLSLDAPRYLLFAWGPLNGAGNDITKHTSDKSATSSRVNLQACRFEGTIISDARANVASILLLFVASLIALLLH